MPCFQGIVYVISIAVCIIFLSAQLESRLATPAAARDPTTRDIPTNERHNRMLIAADLL